MLATLIRAVDRKIVSLMQLLDVIVYHGHTRQSLSRCTIDAGMPGPLAAIHEAYLCDLR